MKVFVTRKIPDEGFAVLDKAEIDYDCNPDDRVLKPEEILAGTQGKDGLLCLLTDAMDKPMLGKLVGLKIKGLANYAVGYNNIDVPEATRLKIPVTNTPGVLTETTADLAWTLISASARRVIEGDQLVRSGGWKGWGPLQFLGGEISGSTLGIVGAGRIGFALAERAKAFKMKILYFARGSHADFDALGAVKKDLPSLLKESDFVSVHVPLNTETKHIIGSKELGLMKKTAYLINTSRGPTVDEAALVAALEKGTIAGAGLDVYEEEPKVHPGLLKLPQAVLLPHLGSATRKTRGKMAEMAATNLVAMVRGERPPNIVNPEVYT